MCSSDLSLGVSSPAFLTALLGLYFFSVLLHIAPSGGMLTPGVPFSFGDLFAHLILPACLLSIGYLALIMRYMRASLLEVLNQDYVRTARAKGVKEFWVIVKHATRNALLPVITLSALLFGELLAGAVLTEQIFTIPGFGKLIVDAVFTRDYPVVQGVVLVTSLFYIILNLLADIGYILVNPRLRS